MHTSQQNYPRAFLTTGYNAPTCFPGMYPCTVALTTRAPMSTRWMNSRGTMLAPRAGGSTRLTPSGEKVPGAYEELLPRPSTAVKGYGDGDDASPVPIPPLVGWFRTRYVERTKSEK